MKRSLKKYPQGGPVKPYRPKDEKEYKARKQAYDDSMSLYIDSKIREGLFLDPNLTGVEFMSEMFNGDKFNQSAKARKAFSNLSKLNGVEPEPFKIKRKFGDGNKGGTDNATIDGYEKPKQLILPPNKDQAPIPAPKNNSNLRRTNKPTSSTKVNPIFTNNPNDPRLKAYNDSLDLYNNSLRNISPGERLDYDKDFINSLYGRDRIKPIAVTSSDGDPAYQRPVQPVIYKPGKIVQKQEVEMIPTNYGTFDMPNISLAPQKIDTSKIKIPDTSKAFKQGRKFMRESGINKEKQNFNKQPGWYEEGGTISKKRSLKKCETGAIVGDTLSYGAQGAMLGSGLGPIGTVAGGALGAGYGLYQGLVDADVQRELDMEREKFKINEENKLRTLGGDNWGPVTSTNSTNFVFAKGGTITKNQPYANAELEKEETFVTPQGQVGQVDAPSHEGGGIEVALPEGTRVFSDKLKYNKKTFAKLTKPINSKIEKLQKQLELNPVSAEAKMNSIELLNKQLDHYFNIQETQKAEKEMKKSLRKKNKYPIGGTIPANDFDLGYVDPELNIPAGAYYPQLPTNEELLTASLNNTPSNVTSPAVNNRFNLKNFFNDNIGEIGQVGAAIGSNIVQANRVRGLKAPRTLSKVNLQGKIASPEMVDYSAERNTIDRATLGLMDSANKGFRNSATAQAFKTKARLNQSEQTGRSFQAQSNINADIKNKFLSQKSDAAMREQLTNNEIDRYNIENAYGYDSSQVANKNTLTSQMFNTAGQMFGNKTRYNNQLDQATILANQYDPSVINDVLKSGNYEIVNGKIVRKRSLRK